MNEAKYYKRTIEKIQINSVELGEQRSVRIFLPPGYNELITYPVMYCQDGEQFFNFGRVATLATRLILDEGLEPMIIVGVDVDTRIRTSEYSPQGERFTSYCRFFVQELIPYVESHFPARQVGAERILAGGSLGATVSLHLALDYPQLFEKVIALSGAFLPSTQQHISQMADLSWLQVYMVIGLEESSVTTESGTFDFLDMNRKTHALLQDHKADVKYMEEPGKHIWGFWQGEIPSALIHFYV